MCYSFVQIPIIPKIKLAYTFMDGLIRKVRSLIIVVLLLFLASREYNISVPWKWYVQILLVIQIKINFIQYKMCCIICICIFFADSAVFPTEIFCIENEVSQALARLLLDISCQFIIKKVSVHFKFSLSDVLWGTGLHWFFSLFYRTTYLRLPLHKLNALWS